MAFTGRGWPCPLKILSLRKLAIKGTISFSSYSNNKRIILYVVLWSWWALKNKREKEKKANACHVIAGPVHPFCFLRSHKVVNLWTIKAKVQIQTDSSQLILSNKIHGSDPSLLIGLCHSVKTFHQCQKVFLAPHLIIFDDYTWWCLYVHMEYFKKVCFSV